MFKNERDASRKLTDAANTIRDKRIRDKIRYSDSLLRGGSQTSDVAAFDRDIQNNLDDLKKKIGEAASAVGNTKPDANAQALDKARQLAQGMQSLGERMRGQQGDQQSAEWPAGPATASRASKARAQASRASKASNGQQGQHGQQGQQGQQPGPARANRASKASRASKANRDSRASKGSKVRDNRANRASRGRAGQQQGSRSGLATAAGTRAIRRRADATGKATTLAR